MSNPRLLMSSKTSDRNRTPITRANDIDTECTGSGPCTTRIATPEEQEEWNSLPPPKKRKSRVMNFKF